MFCKLCKMEIKYSWRSFALMYAILLLSSLFIRTDEGAMSDLMEMFLGLITVLFVAAVFAIIILIIVNVIRNYSRSMFSKEAYLTQTLPVSSTQLLLSKILVALFWTFVSGFVILFCTMLFGFRTVGEFPSFNDWMLIFQRLNLFQVEALVSIVNIVVSYAMLIIQLFFVMTLVHTCYIQKYRFVIGIGIYVVIDYLQSFLIDLIDLPLFNTFMSQLWFTLAVSLLLCCFYFFLTKYLLDHKLEIE